MGLFLNKLGRPLIFRDQGGISRKKEQGKTCEDFYGIGSQDREWQDCAFRNSQSWQYRCG